LPERLFLERFPPLALFFFRVHSRLSVFALRSGVPGAASGMKFSLFLLVRDCRFPSFPLPPLSSFFTFRRRLLACCDVSKTPRPLPFSPVSIWPQRFPFVVGECVDVFLFLVRAGDNFRPRRGQLLVPDPGRLSLIEHGPLGSLRLPLRPQTFLRPLPLPVGLAFTPFFRRTSARTARPPASVIAAQYLMPIFLRDGNFYPSSLFLLCARAFQFRYKAQHSQTSVPAFFVKCSASHDSGTHAPFHFSLV